VGLNEIVVEGLGLHAGAPARVALRASEEHGRATTFNGAPLAEWNAVKAERATAIACGPLRARTVEHLFAAMAALGLQRGVEVTLVGEEAPILDGCAAAWMDALGKLEVGATPATIAVVRDDVIEVGTSRYTFAKESAKGSATRVSVEIEMGDARVAREATWGGDERDFRTRIATARTFCFAHEVEALARAGLASHVTPEMVVVLGPEILAAGRPFEADEPARHKLLDLVGDLFLYGGPPRGEVHAYRPGHWSSHEAMRIAIARGVIGRA
jgi:UDP-3-O-[3-hydroxymyristoyl] N-acetylglucosamine deacetylase